MASNCCNPRLMRPLADDSLTGLPPTAVSMVAARITLGDDAAKLRVLVFGSGNNNRCADDCAVAQTPTSSTSPGVHAVAVAALLHLRLDELVAVDLAFTGAGAEALVSDRFFPLFFFDPRPLGIPVPILLLPHMLASLIPSVCSQRICVLSLSCCARVAGHQTLIRGQHVRVDIDGH
jgi:hypothetical protein